MTGVFDERGRDPLSVLRERLDALDFHLAGRQADELRAYRLRISRLLDAVITRASRPEAPLLVVVAGGSGAGKSTMVNTLAGRPVAATGVVRPTTRTPTLVCHPDDAGWFASPELFPHLTRVGGTARSGAEGETLAVRESVELPGGVALLDTPDIDSVEWRNHRLAEEAMDAADAWLWLVTSRTYADEAGMHYLRLARERQAQVTVVVNQVRDHEEEVVLDDVDRLLRTEGCRPHLRLAIPYVEVTDGTLPPTVVSDLKLWLESSAPLEVRRSLRKGAIEGLRAALPDELAPLLEGTEEEQGKADDLRGAVESGLDRLHGQLEAEIADGVPLRRELLDRWRASLGVGDVAGRVQSVALQVRSAVADAVGRARPTSDPRRVRVEVGDAVTEMIERLLEQAHTEVRRRWENDPVGRTLLEGAPHLRADDEQRAERVRAVVAAWVDHIRQRVDEVAPERQSRARWASTGINAVATTAILVVFTMSGGLTGGEVGIAAGASAASQAVLVRIFGERNLRELLADINADLHTRVDGLIEAEHDRFSEALEAAMPPEDAIDALREMVGRRGRFRGR